MGIRVIYDEMQFESNKMINFHVEKCGKTWRQILDDDFYFIITTLKRFEKIVIFKYDGTWTII